MRRSNPATETPSLEASEPAPANSARSQIEREVVSLFDELRNPLLRYLLSLNLPAPEAEEVVQDVFLALFQHLRLGRSRSNLRGWLFRVAHNLGLKRTRRLGRYVSPLDAAEWDIAGRHPDPAPSAEDRLMFEQRQQRLRAVLRALPERCRNCLFLRAEGLRYRDIAQVLGISLGAVALSLERALTRLSAGDR